jgi:hypothetical protein
MKILSWDIGIYNCSYIIIEIADDKTLNILDWDIVNFIDDEKMKKNKPLMFSNIPKKLDAIPKLLDVNIVLIENQPSLKNPQMKSVQMIIYSYFLIKGDSLKIEFISAMNKLKKINNCIVDDEETCTLINNIKEKTKSSYTQKKKISIIYCEKIIKDHDKFNNYLDFFKNNSKKDDLADSFLQCYYYIHNIHT